MNRTRTYVPRTRIAISEAQRQVLASIQDHVRAHKLSPTYQEVMESAGKAKGTVRSIIGCLIRLGYVDRGPGRYRNLVVTTRGAAVLRKAVSR